MPLSTKYTVLLVVAIGILQCAATQLSATAYTENDHQLGKHIYFLTYISIFANIVLLPVHSFMENREQEKQKKKINNNKNHVENYDSLSQQEDDEENENENENSSRNSSTRVSIQSKSKEEKGTSSSLLQTSSKLKYTFYELTAIVVFLYFCYIIANGAYSVALSVGTRPSITASIFAVCPVFVVFLSWLVLKIKPLFIHWIALVAGVVGVLVVLQPWKVTSLFSLETPSTNNNNNDENNNNNPSGDSGASPPTLLAIFASVLSPIFAATYKVYFSKFFQNSRWHEAGRILSLLTIPNLVIGTGLVSVVMFGTNLESPPWSSGSSSLNSSSSFFSNNASSSSSSFANVPASTWWLFVVAKIVGLAFNLVVNWGVTVVQPLYVSVGTILATMCNIFVDAALGRGWPDPVAWVGMALIIVSFICVAVSGRFEKKKKDELATRTAEMFFVEEEERTSTRRSVLDVVGNGNDPMEI